MTPPVAMAVAVPGTTSRTGATPQAMTSPLSVSRFGVPGLAPSVSAARSATPSTLARSNGGVSIGATTSVAMTRDSAAASGTDSPASGARSSCASKRRRASAAETTSRNCSCRAARRIASIIAARAGLASGLIAAAKTNSWPLVHGNLAARGKAFALGRNHDPAVAAAKRGQGQISGPKRLRHPIATAHRDDLGHPDGRCHLAPQRQNHRSVLDHAAGEFGDKMPANQQPNRERGIEPTRNEQYRLAADKTHSRGLARANGNAMRFDAAAPRQFLHRIIAPSAAGAADANDGIALTFA